MELLQGIETRATARGFKSAPITKDIWDKILRAAGNSPSYTNTQPWEIAIVCGQKKDELSQIIRELAKTKVTPNPDIPVPPSWPLDLEKRSREHGARRLAAIGVLREDQTARENLRLKNYDFYGAPCVVFIYMDSMLSAWSIFDLGLFAQNLILAAHSFGVGSCLQGSIVYYPDAVRDFLGLPKTKKLIIGVSMGYPDKEAKLNTYRAQKLKPEEFVKWYQ